MATYKCKQCSHEVVAAVQPTECDICGSNEIVLVRNQVTAYAEEKVTVKSFRAIIQSFCKQIGWVINDLSDRRAIIRFSMPSGKVQNIFIIRHNTTLEFSVTSGVKFNSQNEIPGWLSTLLLCQNTDYRIGFWCIEDIDGKKTCSLMHNTEFRLIDFAYFKKIVIHLVDECDKFEQSVEKILKEL